MNHDLRNIKHFVHNVHSYILYCTMDAFGPCVLGYVQTADPKNVLTKQGSLHKGMTYNLGNVWNVYILRVHQKRK